MTEQRGHVPYVILNGGPRHGTILAEVDLTTDDLAGYRKTADAHDYVLNGPRGGQKVYQLRVWRYVGA